MLPRIRYSCALLAASLLVAPLSAQEKKKDDDEFAKLPSEELHAEADPNKVYYLNGPKKGADRPDGGWRLLVVLPGGDGGPGFRNFVRRIQLHALGEDYLVAHLVAPPWKTPANTWPSKKSPTPKMEFTTTEFISAVVRDVETRHRIDPKYVFALAWSSSGPKVYAASLEKDTPLTGSFIVMSVFHRDECPSLSNAKGRAWYLLHSPTDPKCPIRLAREAEELLTKKKGKVEFVEYEGGHRWPQGTIYRDLRAGIEWLEDNRSKPAKRKRGKLGKTKKPKKKKKATER